jgi:predicted dehydrogenase
MADQSRRSFLAASASATLATTGLSRVIAAPTAFKAQQDSQTIRMAVIGAGGRGGSHVQAWLNAANCEIAAIVDVDDAQAKRKVDQIEKYYKKKNQAAPPIKTARDIREILDDDSINTVSIATPNHWHALGGVWAMQAGKDAYIEKPVCHNIQEGAALIAAARGLGRICQVGTQCRSAQALQEAMAFIKSGGIGEVKLARGLCYKRRAAIGPLGDYKVPENCDFDLWSGPATFTSPKVTRGRFHYDWHWQRHYGNGDLGNQGPHQTDIARWGLGVDTHPNSIVSYGGRLGYQAEKKDAKYVDAGDTANTEVSIYDYGDKCLVFETRGLGVKGSDDPIVNKLFQRKPKDGNVIGVIFFGSEGYLAQRSYSHCTAYDKNFNVIKEFKGGGDHFGNFLQACRSRNHKELNADVREGHLSAGVSHLGNISYYLGEGNKQSVKQIGETLSGIKSLDDNEETLSRTVKHLQKNGVDLAKYPMSMGPVLNFDPEKETFADNAAADAMLTREYRDGFVCPKPSEIKVREKVG